MNSLSENISNEKHLLYKRADKPIDQYIHCETSGVLQNKNNEQKVIIISTLMAFILIFQCIKISIQLLSMS